LVAPLASATEGEGLNYTGEEPYSIERRLAAGGMAEVFVAKRMGPHGFEKRVALKRILPQFAIDADFVHMFIDEARLAARLSHANIVQVFDFGQQEGTFFIAMELIDGSNVNQLLRAVALRDEAVPLDVALHIAAEAAQALAYAHALRDDQGEPLRIVHRDVSPANLLLTRDGHVKLSDFGIARAASFEARTQTGQLRGKLGYMSPEQVLGRELDGRSDVFTLTTILTEMLIAEPLFGKGQDLDVLMRIRDVDLSVLENTRRRVPNDVRALIERGLSRRSEDRPEASALLRMLQDLMQRRAVSSSAGRLARLLARLELMDSQPGETHSPESSIKPANFLELEPQTDLTEPNVAETIRYRVRGENGMVGPVSYSELVELILGGHVDSDTMISRANHPFERAGGIAELRRFLSTPALQWRAREHTAPTRQGSLKNGALLAVVHRISHGQDTGLLHLQDGPRQKKIYFVDGRPEYIASTDRGELLGEQLVNTGVCLRMEVDMALAVLHRYDGRLGDALVGLGVLRPMALVRAVRNQVRRRFIEAFHWRSGEWRFIRGAHSQEETFALQFDPYELLGEAVAELDIDDVETWLVPLRDRVLVRATNAPLPLSAYRVPREWTAAIEQVNGQDTLSLLLARESVQRSGDIDDVYRALYLALSGEALRVR
jgi:eukaryotic-like serine/threonine-protein kinase